MPSSPQRSDGLEARVRDCASRIKITAPDVARTVMQGIEQNEHVRDAVVALVRECAGAEWTREVPTAPGFYFLRHDRPNADTLMRARPVLVGWASFGDGRALRVSHDPFGHKTYLHNTIVFADATWSGPIPTPRAPESGGSE